MDDALPRRETFSIMFRFIYFWNRWETSCSHYHKLFDVHSAMVMQNKRCLFFHVNLLEGFLSSICVFECLSGLLADLVGGTWSIVSSYSRRCCSKIVHCIGGGILTSDECCMFMVSRRLENLNFSAICWRDLFIQDQDNVHLCLCASSVCMCGRGNVLCRRYDR